MSTIGQSAASYFNTALAAERAGRADEAEALYRELLTYFPREVGAMDRIGVIILARGDPGGALPWFQAALRTQPDFGPAGVNAGITLQILGRPGEAEAVFVQTAALAPGFAAGHFMLSQFLWDRGEFERACESLARAIDLAPEFFIENYNTLSRRLNESDWRGYEALTAMMIGRIRAGILVTTPLSFLYYSQSAADQALCMRTYAAGVHPPLAPLWTGQPRRPGKIRLAYLSPDMHQHPVTVLMSGVYEHHDRGQFELFAISVGPPQADDYRQRVTRAVDHFIEASHLSDHEVTTLIRRHDIDILVDLSGYTANARNNILAGRPAPIQVNFLGYPGTLGAPYVDYIIADREVVPPQDREHYAEQVVWMPHTYQPTDDTTPVPDRPPSRAEQGLPQTGFVFSAYNASRKITPAMFDVWMRILSRTPASILWLQSPGEAGIANLRAEAARRGVDPARLYFAPWAADRSEHLARLPLAGLYLDTLPYNAHSVASDHLWAGVPVVTCRGQAFPGRVCASLLQAAGLPQLVTENLHAYEELAVALAADPARLSALREHIAAQVRSRPLFQTAAYTRHLEDAYRQMFERRQQGLQAAPVEVAG